MLIHIYTLFWNGKNHFEQILLGLEIFHKAAVAYLEAPWNCSNHYFLQIYIKKKKNIYICKKDLILLSITLKRNFSVYMLYNIKMIISYFLRQPPHP